MAAGPHHRTLTAQLRTWTDGQIATLLRRRPDLVEPEPPASIENLAQRAQYEPSLAAAIANTTLPENRLLQLVVCVRPAIPLAELARNLPDGVTLADVEPVVESLEAAALIWRYEDRLHCSGSLRQCMPTTLGPPLTQLAGAQTVDFLKQAVLLIRRGAARAIGEDALPARAIGPSGRPPRKTELVDELEALLSTPDVVTALLSSAPAEAAHLARTMAEGRPSIPLPGYLYYSPYNRQPYYHGQPEWWLFERAMVLPDTRYTNAASQPRCVGVALRDGRPVTDLGLARPDLAVGVADIRRVDSQAASRAEQTLDRLADIIDHWMSEPAKELKAGGIGVSVMRQLAIRVDTDVEETSRLVEFLAVAGLLARERSTRKEGRQYVSDSFVKPSDAASAWLVRPAAVRWCQLGAAWLRAAHWPSASGRNDPRTGKAIAVLSSQYRTADAPARRADLLAALAELDGADGTSAPATTPAALAAYTYWRQPQSWLANPAGDPATSAAWIYTEAEDLGIIAHGRLSTFGQALVAGDHADAERAFDESRPEPATSFIVQADMTVVAVGALARDIATELRVLADVEAKDEATTYRLSEATVRRAIDSGRDAESIVAFLREHAAKGVPRPVEYMVRDVARRHGHLRVVAATTVVCSDDPAVLADACSHKRTRQLKLRTIAPTVAVSPLEPKKVMAGLREAGFFPAADDAGVSLQRPDASASPPSRAAAPTELPEPFRYRPHDHARAPAPLGAAAADALAEKIRAGQPPDVPSNRTLKAKPATTTSASYVDDPVDDEFDDLEVGDAAKVLAKLEAMFGDEIGEVVFLHEHVRSGRRRGRKR